VTKGELEEPKLYDMLQTQKTEDSFKKKQINNNLKTD
jgi:hypothetical protein